MPNRILFVAALASLVTGSIESQQRDLTPYFIASRADEVALARSAAPRHVSDSATVLVLTRQGYVEAAHGTNGFTCLVLRSFAGRATDPTFWTPTTRAPNCLNRPASRTVLPEMLKQTEWVLAGVSQTEIGTRALRGYSSHEFPMPAQGAMTYMLSHEQMLTPTDPHWKPHLMFWFDSSMPASAWGAGDGDAPIINASGTDKYPVMTLLIPVRQWSDGSTAMDTPAH